MLSAVLSFRSLFLFFLNFLFYQTRSVLPNYMPHPGGFLRHQSCVYTVPNGTLVHKIISAQERHLAVTFPNGTQRIIPNCSFPDLTPEDSPNVYNYAMFNTGTAIKELYASWNVPQTPTHTIPSNTFLYYWVGTCANRGGARGFNVLQPVLGYSQSYGWRLDAVYDDAYSQTTLRGPYISLGSASGDLVESFITRSDDGSYYEQWGVHSKSKKSSYLKVASDVTDVQTWVNGGTTEYWYADSCSVYPPNGIVTFENISITNTHGDFVTPNWKLYVPNKQCNANAVSSSKSVKFTWKAN